MVPTPRVGPRLGRSIIRRGTGVRRLGGAARLEWPVCTPHPADRSFCPEPDGAKPVVPPPEAGTVSGPAAVDRAVRRRFYGGIWRLPAFETTGDRRRFTQQLKVYELLHAVPEPLMGGVLGPNAVREVPSETERVSLVAALVASKAGPEGGNAHKALRAWRLLQEAAQRMGRTDYGLPCGRALVGAIVMREQTRATAAGTEARDGATVGGTVREGFEWLEAVLKLPIEAKSDVVEAAAEPPPLTNGVRRAVKQSASAPPCVQLHLEELARAREWSVARVMARELLVKCAVQHVRLNDALNAQTWQCVQDATVIRGKTTTRSKDGLALELYAPAEGWLGTFGWWAEHAAEMAQRGSGYPDFSAPGPQVATAPGLKAGVLPKSKALPMLRALCAMAPLRMDAAEFNALNITTHSFHGSGPDLVRFLGMCQVEYVFTEIDVRRIGHWLRDRSAPQETVTRVGRHTTGATNQRGEMAFRYTSGAGRIGERQEQLVVRARLVTTVRTALAAYGAHWLELPRHAGAWDVLFPTTR